MQSSCARSPSPNRRRPRTHPPAPRPSPLRSPKPCVLRRPRSAVLPEHRPGRVPRHRGQSCGGRRGAGARLGRECRARRADQRAPSARARAVLGARRRARRGIRCHLVVRVGRRQRRASRAGSKARSPSGKPRPRRGCARRVRRALPSPPRRATPRGSRRAGRRRRRVVRRGRDQRVRSLVGQTRRRSPAVRPRRRDCTRTATGCSRSIRRATTKPARGATLGHFFREGGWDLDAERIEAWDGQEHRNGDRCPEWAASRHCATRSTASTRDGDPAAVRLANRMVIAIAFVPAGAVVGSPPQAAAARPAPLGARGNALSNRRRPRPWRRWPKRLDGVQGR